MGRRVGTERANQRPPSALSINEAIDLLAPIRQCGLRRARGILCQGPAGLQPPPPTADRLAGGAWARPFKRVASRREPDADGGHRLPNWRPAGEAINSFSGSVWPPPTHRSTHTIHQRLACSSPLGAGLALAGARPRDSSDYLKCCRN